MHSKQRSTFAGAASLSLLFGCYNVDCSGYSCMGNAYNEVDLFLWSRGQRFAVKFSWQLALSSLHAVGGHNILTVAWCLQFGFASVILSHQGDKHQTDY